MNEKTAKRKAKQFKSRTVSGWVVDEYIGSGKSAFVCKAIKGKRLAAIKIFETEDLDRDETVELDLRLKRQLELKSKKHPNLIRIFEGGYSDQYKAYYLIMEYVEAKPLSSVIKDVPINRIETIIAQLSAAAQFLESLKLVHRDIKPDNIVITSDFKKITLLDFGVIRPVGAGIITDSTNVKKFTGTLRYSSPEFLLRNEEDSLDGWRAVTFYQIGAVLHDLIMREPIFKGHTEPYARLVEAVLNNQPKIFNDDVHPDLIELAKLCLIKNPKIRLQMLSWDVFKSIKKDRKDIKSIQERIKVRQETSKRINQSKYDAQNHIRKQMIFDLRSIIDTAIRKTCIGNVLFPKITIKPIDNNNRYDLCYVIIFTPAEHKLSYELNIVLTLDLIEHEPDLIQIYCIGVFKHNLELNKAFENLNHLYKGEINAEAINHAIKGMLYVCLDNAQRKTDEADSDVKGYSPWISF